MQAHVINMAEALLARGRDLWEKDRYPEATQVFTRLLGLRVLSPAIAERAQFYLGDMQLAQGNYAKARRHLTAALANGTDSGDLHFLMACAIDWDDDSDPRLAYRHYRQAVTLEPGQPLYSSSYALTRIRRKAGASKFDREALRRLRDAFAAEPDDPDIVYNYVSGLIQMGRHGEAEIALRRARKRWLGHPAFQELWHEFLTATGERPASGVTSRSVPQPQGPTRLRIFAADEPVILKFPATQPFTSAPKPLGKNARLRTALATLSEPAVAELARSLQLLPADAAQQRDHIQRALQDVETLRAVLSRLSVGSRHLIQVIDHSGGSAALRSLRLRVDGPSVPTPHFGHRAPARPLDELCRAGLVFLTTATAGVTGPDIAMIPSDLRKTLREAMWQQNQNQSQSPRRQTSGG